MVDLFAKIASRTVSLFSALLKRVLPKLLDYLLAPRNRHIFPKLVWVTCVVILLAVSAAAVFGSGALFDTYKPGIVVAVVLWSLFLGTTASILLPSKAIVATFGGFVGVSLSEVGSAAGLISILRKQVTAIAIELGAISNPGGQIPATPDSFITWMIWLFVGLTAVLCLPAFLEREKQ